MCLIFFFNFFFFFKQKTAYEMRISDWSSDVCSSDLPAEVGKLFCTHPVIRKISFTGSTAVGKLLLSQAGSTVKKACMELGGNAPFIVFEDADIDAAVDGAMIAKYRNAGQACIGANRLLVQQSVHDRIVERLAARVGALKVGNGMEAGMQIGPLINDRSEAHTSELQSLMRNSYAVFFLSKKNS